MPKRSKSLLQRLIPGFFLGFAVFLTLLIFGDIRKVGSTFLDFRWVHLPLILVLSGLNYSLRFVKWHYYLNLVNGSQISPLSSAKIFIAGLPLAVTPGNVGEALKGIWLNQESGMPTAQGMSVIVAERISDGLGVLALSTLGVIAYPRYWPVFTAALLAIFVLITLTQIRPAALKLLSWGEQLPIVRTFIEPLHEFYEGSHTLLGPKPTLVGLVLGALSWLWEGVGLYVVLRGLGLAPSWQTLATSVFIFSFSSLVGGISTLPGGLGAAEASLAGMLTLLLGVTGDIASASTLLIRFGTLWFGVILGIAVWALSPDLLQIHREKHPVNN